MYEVAPSAGSFLIDEVPRLAQLVLLGSLCGWTAHRLMGLNLNMYGLKVFLGFAGLETGAWLWRSFSWQPGPTIADFSLLASFAGAFLLFGFLKLVEVAIAARTGIL